MEIVCRRLDLSFSIFQKPYRNKSQIFHLLVHVFCASPIKTFLNWSKKTMFSKQISLTTLPCIQSIEDVEKTRNHAIFSCHSQLKFIMKSFYFFIQIQHGCPLLNGTILFWMVGVDFDWTSENNGIQMFQTFEWNLSLLIC